MSGLKFLPVEEGKSRKMFFGKSLTFDEEELSNVALATVPVSVRSPSEIEFIEKLKAGDAQAFDYLVVKYSADIYALLFRLTQDAEETSDLTQETFLSALKAINKFRGDADLKTWLVRIAINESRNRFRWWKRRRREKTVSMDATVGESEITLGETFSSHFASPEDTFPTPLLRHLLFWNLFADACRRLEIHSENFQGLPPKVFWQTPLS